MDDLNLGDPDYGLIAMEGGLDQIVSKLDSVSSDWMVFGMHIQKVGWRYLQWLMESDIGMDFQILICGCAIQMPKGVDPSVEWMVVVLGVQAH